MNSFRQLASRARNNGCSMSMVKLPGRTIISVEQSSLTTAAARFSQGSRWSSSTTKSTPVAISEFNSATTAAATTTSNSGISSLESLGALSPSVLEQSGLLELCRHGPGDAVIVLNVGGTEFKTLRSTVASNPVLAECVARAEANAERIGSNNAVFVDRDPTYFPLILNHLRNKVEGLSFSSNSQKMMACKDKQHFVQHRVQLPKDLNALRDIYVEATHYRIQELKQSSCRQNFMVTIMEALGGGGSNPFDMVNRMFQVIRRSLVAMGSIGTVAFTSQQDINFTRIGAVMFPAWIQSKEGGGSEGESKPSEQIAA